MMKNSRSDSLNRRRLIAMGLTAPLAATAAAAEHALKLRKESDPWHGLKMGVASYTLRTLPLPEAIKAIRRVGLDYVSIKDFHLPMKSSADERKAVVGAFEKAGIQALSCGVVNMKNDPAEIRHAFQYARDAGIPIIVCSPDPASMPVLDRMVKEFDIKLAIHNHGPGDMKFPSPYDVMKAAESYDRRIGLCIDVGHTARIGVDPAGAIRDCRERLYDMHLKDVNKAAPAGTPVELGRGVLDLRGILQALLDVRFDGHTGIEYEKDAADPVPGLAESVGYLRGLLA